MRSLPALSVFLLLAACAHGRPEAGARLIVSSLPEHCLDTSRNDAIPIAVTNGASRPISLSLSKTAGTPLSLHPRAFEIVPTDPVSDDPSNWGVLLEHYVPPRGEVRLEAGDSVELRAYASLWPLSGYAGTVAVQVRDTRGRVHRSGQLSVCSSGSVPNSSSKPTPLRGAAKLRC